MNYSLKMARLDYFTCKPNIISYFTLIPVTIIFSFMSTSSIFIFNFTAAWFIALMSTNIFVVQEKNELERLYASLSLTTQNIVAGRYIYTYATFLLAYIFTTLVGVISIILKHESVNGLDIITSFSLSLFTFTAIIAIQLPLYFRYGYSKAKIYCLIHFFPSLLMQKYYLIKGEPAKLTNELKKDILGIRSTTIGFEGLVETKLAHKYKGYILDVPTIDDIIICMSKEGKK